jgi:protein-disulfide isomerase
LHRQGRRAEIFRRHRPPVPPDERLGVEEHHGTRDAIGKQAGLSQQQVEDCLKDQALLDKIAADQKFANDVLKVNSTPTFFINGEMLKGETSFEEFDKKIKALLKS